MIFRHLLNMRSHPTWVRGLKQAQLRRMSTRSIVAPYVGAWIETVLSSRKRILRFVAPYVGAWIETSSCTSFDTYCKVAPYVGAWIETTIV